MGHAVQQSRFKQMSETRQEAVTQAALGTPPVAVVGIDMLTAVPVESWIKWATFAYIILQIAYLIYKWVREHRAKDAPAKRRRKPNANASAEAESGT